MYTSYDTLRDYCLLSLCKTWKRIWGEHCHVDTRLLLKMVELIIVADTTVIQIIHQRLETPGKTRIMSVIKTNIFVLLGFIAISVTYLFAFYRASTYASAVLAVVIVSVCLSHACFVTKSKQCTANILTPPEKAITSLLSPTVVGGRRLLPSEICAQSDPPLRKTPTSTDFGLWRLSRKR